MLVWLTWKHLNTNATKWQKWTNYLANQQLYEPEVDQPRPWLRLIKLKEILKAHIMWFTSKSVHFWKIINAMNCSHFKIYLSNFNFIKFCDFLIKMHKWDTTEKIFPGIPMVPLQWKELEQENLSVEANSLLSNWSRRGSLFDEDQVNKFQHIQGVGRGLGVWRSYLELEKNTNKLVAR